MNALARATINAAAYLELADESLVDPDLALQALEEIAYNLSHCTEEEKQAIEAALEDMKAAERGNLTRPEMLEFLESFPIAFGLREETDALPDSDGEERVNLL